MKTLASNLNNISILYTGTEILLSDIKKRNYLIAFIAGAINGIAWWIIIDILVRSAEHLFARVYILPGAAITLMLIILLHCIPDAAIHDENRIINIFSIVVQVYVIVIQQNVQAFHYLLFFLLSFQPLLLVYGYLLQIMPVQMKLIKKSGYVQWFGAGNMVFTILFAIAACIEV